MSVEVPLSIFDRGPQDTAQSEMMRLLDVTHQQSDEIARLRAECFRLAAGQCANVFADEGGTPQCAEIERLRAKLSQQIDYPLLIADCYSSTKQAQGTRGCIQFARGADWWREQIQKA